MKFKPMWSWAAGTAIAVTLSACGQEPAPAAVAIPPSPASTTSHAHSLTHADNTPVVETAASGTQTNSSCTIELGSNDAMQFSLKQIVIPAHCEKATIRLNHNGKLPQSAMGHNIVITSQANLNGVLSDGLKAGKEHDFVMPNDERVLAKSKLLGGGESDSITIDVAKLKDEPHIFVCTFPGHSGPMRGNIIVQ